MTTSNAAAEEAGLIERTGLCLLSLDGGGVRGLSILYILKNIMSGINAARGKTGQPPVKPCEIFDLIGGTSTGGLIAIMLGRLEMDVDECISTYTELMEDVFKKKKHQSRVNFLFEVQPQFDSTRLKRAIEKAIRLKGRSPDEPFSSGPGSKVFVCATSKDINTGIRLRSYKLSQYPDNVHPTICQAALATSAATTFFNPVVIGTRTFVDGALWANNPVDEVEREATDIWCSESGELTPLIKCFISIGTGNSGLKPVKDRRLTSLVETLARITTETEGTARKSMARFRGLLEKGRYFRFNVEQGLQHVGLEEFRAAPVIEAATEDYLDSQERQAKVTSCVANLIHKESVYILTEQFS